MSDVKFGVDKFKNIYGKECSTPVGRAYFTYLSTPRANVNYPDQPPKRSICLLFDKKDKTIEKQLNPILQMLQKMVVQKVGAAKAEKWKAARPLLQDGDEMDTKKYPELKGQIVLTASTKGMPEIIDRDTNPIAPEEIQSGRRVRLMVRPTLLSSNKISFQLCAVQAGKDDGVRYYAGPKAASFMGALEADGPEFDDDDDVTADEAADEAIGDSKKKRHRRTKAEMEAGRTKSEKKGKKAKKVEEDDEEEEEEEEESGEEEESEEETGEESEDEDEDEESEEDTNEGDNKGKGGKALALSVV